MAGDLHPAVVPVAPVGPDTIQGDRGRPVMDLARRTIRPLVSSTSLGEFSVPAGSKHVTEHEERAHDHIPWLNRGTPPVPEGCVDHRDATGRCRSGGRCCGCAEPGQQNSCRSYGCRQFPNMHAMHTLPPTLELLALSIPCCFTFGTQVLPRGDGRDKCQWFPPGSG